MGDDANRLRKRVRDAIEGPVSESEKLLNDLTTATDEALLVGAQGGDGAAFEALVRRYTQPLYAFATRILGSAEPRLVFGCPTLIPRLHEATPRQSPRPSWHSASAG